MFSRFNLIARPLESERPPSLTEDQITTHYFHHLESVLSAKNFRELERDIQEAERRRDADGRRHLNRHHMHDMALRQEREGVLKRTRLRATGIVSTPRVPIQDRVTNKVANRLGNQSKDKEQPNGPNRACPDERERRTCNNCLVRGHLAKDCTNRTADKVKEANYLKNLNIRCWKTKSNLTARS